MLTIWPIDSFTIYADKLQGMVVALNVSGLVLIAATVALTLLPI